MCEEGESLHLKISGLNGQDTVEQSIILFVTAFPFTSSASIRQTHVHVDRMPFHAKQTLFA